MFFIQTKILYSCIWRIILADIFTNFMVFLSLTTELLKFYFQIGLAKLPVIIQSFLIRHYRAYCVLSIHVKTYCIKLYI